MTNVTQFTPSGTPVTFYPGPEVVTSAAMPTVDGGNVDTLITNLGNGPVSFAFGVSLPAGTVPVVGQGGMTVQPGAANAVLVTSNAAVLTATQTNPLVIASAVAGVATAIFAQSQMRGSAGVTVTRGTASTKSAF